MQLPKIHKSKSNISILNCKDYERIKQNAKNTSQENVLNQKIIKTQQKETQLAKARAHLERIRQFDRRRPKLPWLNGDQELEKEKTQILLNAKQCKEEEYDLSKRMNQLLHYAKVVTIRDIQKKESKKIDAEFKKKEEKLDLMMELERLKGLKQEEEKKKIKQKQRYEEAKILREQIKEKEIQRQKEKEFTIQEGEKIKKHIIELEEADKKLEEKKKMEKINLAKEIVERNKLSSIEKEKKINEEKENDLKILKYNIERKKKEEEELMQKKLLQIQKEKETQKLREKQEQISDKQALLDELRAKRAFEDNEKKQREKERLEMLKILKQKKELIEGNEIQKITKKNKLIQQAVNDQKEYEDIVRHQLAEVEEEKKAETVRKKTLDENGREVLRQISERKEKEMLFRRTILEEGRILKQNQDEYRKTLERIKLQKLKEMEKFGVTPSHRVDLLKFKIV